MFKCMVCVHKLDGNRKKLDDNIHSSITVSYSSDSNPYRLFYPRKQEFICKRNVVFDEQNLGTSLYETYSRLSSRDPLEILKNIKTTN